MIRVRDALLLAGTKLRTRRIRTTITILLSSVLFAVIVAALVLANGAFKSLRDFNSGGINDRYLVSASADPRLGGGMLGSKELFALAKKDYKKLVAEKVAEAKKLGVPYDPTSEPKAVNTIRYPGAISSHESIDINSPAAQQAIRDYLHAHPGPGIDALKKVAAGYHPTAIYTDVPAFLADGEMQTMPGGKENFSAEKNFFDNARLTKMSGTLTDPFIEQGVQLGNGNVPLVVSYTRAEHLLGLDTLSKSASVHQKYERIKKLYDALHTNKMTATTCYRNFVSSDQITTALTQMANKKVDQNAAVHYVLPSASSCGAVTIAQDARTDAEKQQAAAQRQFDSDFSVLLQQPEQRKVTFQVVGLYSDTVTSADNLSFFGLLSSVTGSSLDGDDVIPANMLGSVDSSLKNLLFSSTDRLGDVQQTYTVEFSSAQDARQFIHDKSCTTRMSGTCASPGKPFNLRAYGNSSIALGSISKKMTKWIVMAAIVVAIFAAVIMSTMVGRMIVDGRKESAVFRALGARRSDIAAIYVTYTFVLTILILIVSFGIGLIGAFVVSQYFGTHSTEQVRVLFGAVDTDMRVQLFRPDFAKLALVAIGIVIVGLLSTVVPLMRNVRRNPINDLREE